MVFKVITYIFFTLLLFSCTSGQKQSIVEKDVFVVSFSAQNQLDQTDNSMGWIDDEGIVPYDIHWGWKCSKQGDKSFVWLSQVRRDASSGEINVSEDYCKEKEIK